MDDERRRKPFWQESGWQCVSYGLPMEQMEWYRDWANNPMDRNEYCDIIKTEDCLIPDEKDDESQIKIKRNEDGLSRKG